MSRRVTLGESSASPAATARTARSSSVGSVSFTRNPLAPLRSASNTYSSSSNVVRITTRTASSAGSAPMRRVAVEPVDAGHADVHEDDVGALPPGRPRRPRRRRPPRRRPRCRPGRRAAPGNRPRTSAWSSASTTRMVAVAHRCAPSGIRARTRKPAAGSGGTDLEAPAERVHPFAHPDDALARRCGPARAPRPSSSTCTTSTSAP